MKIIVRVLIAISALSFVLAVVSHLLGGILFEINAQTYSKACSNLALIAIALALSFRGQNQ